MADPSPDQHEVTALLHAWRNGNQGALEMLVPVVYRELHRLAHRYMQHERAGHVMQTTAFVNEVYLNLFDVKKVNWQDRAHFFAISAKLMRQILVHMARSMDAKKRGGQFRQERLDEAFAMSPQPNLQLLAVDEALSALAALDARSASVVELRFFGGMTMEETAEALGISSDTVLRDWRWAKLWLSRRIKHGATNES